MKQTYHRPSSAPLVATFLAALLLVGACAQDDPSDGHGADVGSDTAVADTGQPDTARQDSGRADIGADDTGNDLGSDTAPSGPVLQVATYNVRLLFDTLCDSGNCNESSFEQAPSQADYEARLAQVAQGIMRLEADVVLLQEIEKASVLEDLADTLRSYGVDYPVAVHAETGYAGSVDVAVLSRGRLLSTREYSDPFVREFLEAHLEIDGEQVIVFSAHFKAKINDNPTLRLTEAREARRLADEASEAAPDALVILGGDLNDTPGSPPLEALTSSGGLYLTSDGERFDDYWTLYYEERVAIDHLLVARNNGGRYLPGSLIARHNDNDGSGWFGSDHGALLARFELF